MEFHDELRSLLHILFPDAIDRAGNKEVTINCPLCAKEGNPDTGHHMYISLGYDNKPPMYNCFKNINHRGLLSKSFLEENSNQFQSLDTSLFDNLEIQRKKLSSLSRYRLNKQGKLNITPQNFYDKQLSDIKLKYINDRLGLNLTYDDCTRNKIILNLFDLFKYNKIDKFTRDGRVLKNLNIFFLGFLVNNNSYLIMRNLTKKKGILPDYLDRRYIKYKITNNDYPNSYYIIPTVCNVFDKIKIHIAEGSFDILSVYYNLRNQESKNNIYAAIGGNTYESLINFFLVDYSLIDVEFHFYIDNDIPSYIIPRLKAILYPLGISTYIHNNMYPGEKDFGVDLNHIKEYTYQLI